MGLFRTAEEKFIRKEMKDLRQRTKRTLKISQYAGNLERCKMNFEQIIASERMNALERQKNNMSDSIQLERIHDAAVGLLAAQEVGMELRSLESALDLTASEKAMQKMLGKLYRMNHYLSITKKDLKNELGMAFDNSAETADFSDRVEMLDEGFMNELLQGERFEDCLKKRTKKMSVLNSIPIDTIDFSNAGKKAAEEAEDIMKADAEQR